jgi:hypothetical protein
VTGVTVVYGILMLLLWRHEERKSLGPRLILAELGWEDAHRTLCDYARRLTDQKKPLPHDLQAYIVFAASGGFKARKKFKRSVRNVAIASAIAKLVDEGYNPTRNAATAATIEPSAWSGGAKLNVSLRILAAMATFSPWSSFIVGPRRRAYRHRSVASRSASSARWL